MGHCIKTEVQSNRAHTASASLPHQHCNYHKQSSSVYTYVYVELQELHLFIEVSACESVHVGALALMYICLRASFCQVLRGFAVVT